MEPQFIEKRFKAIEQSQADTERTLDNHTEILKELDQKSDLHTQAFVRVEMLLGEHSRGISMLQTDVETLKGLVKEGFQSIEKRFDAIAEVQKLILSRLPERGE